MLRSSTPRFSVKISIVVEHMLAPGITRQEPIIYCDVRPRGMSNMRSRRNLAIDTDLVDIGFTDLVPW